MKVKKYNGCGNDFVILPFEEGQDYGQVAQKLCQDFDTDGLIAVKNEPLEMIFHNRDGSRAPMCGNGIRCFSQYVLDQHLISNDTKTFPVETLAGTMKVELLQNEPFMARINMGRPKFADGSMKMTVPDTGIHELEIDGQRITLHTVFMGTIHTVIFVENALAMLDSDFGQIICHHPWFSEGTNVNFVQVNDRENLTVRTFERGVGWTLACGTGCCASAVIAQKEKLVDQQVHVHLERGELLIENKDGDIFMTGPSEFEEEREVNLNA